MGTLSGIHDISLFTYNWYLKGGGSYLSVLFVCFICLFYLSILCYLLKATNVRLWCIIHGRVVGVIISCSDTVGWCFYHKQVGNTYITVDIWGWYVTSTNDVQYLNVVIFGRSVGDVIEYHNTIKVSLVPWKDLSVLVGSSYILYCK